MIRSRCLRPRQTFDSIEYHRDNSKISLLLLSASSNSNKNSCNEYSPHSTTVLITFPANATLKQILTETEFMNLISNYSSIPINNDNQAKSNAHFELNGTIIDENIELESVIAKETFILITDKNFPLKFHETKDTELKLSVIQKFRENLSHRLPTEDGHRPSTSPHLVYPNESLDLLFDTLNGQLTYLFEYLQSHFGERHEFTTYEIQKQSHNEYRQWNEWETGIYRMHGTMNGTVNIALASDW